MAEPLLELYRRVERGGATPRNPFVTLTYAQSLDGSIAAAPGQPTRLSGDQSLRMTHELRARHQAILIGIGTVLSDDPQLNVRLADGPDPVPVILDSRLRTPLDSQIVKGSQQAWIVHGPGASDDRRRKLTDAGVQLLQVPRAEGGLDLKHVLRQLYQAGLEHVMIEGGARVIGSVLDIGCADLFVLTISPRLLTGLRPVDGQARSMPRLRQPKWAVVGPDAVLWGELR